MPPKPCQAMHSRMNGGLLNPPLPRTHLVLRQVGMSTLQPGQQREFTRTRTHVRTQTPAQRTGNTQVRAANPSNTYIGAQNQSTRAQIPQMPPAKSTAAARAGFNKPNTPGGASGPQRGKPSWDIPILEVPPLAGIRIL